MYLTGGSTADILLHVEILLAARTQYHVETQQQSSAKGTTILSNLPIYQMTCDMCSCPLFKSLNQCCTAVGNAGEYGASKIDAYGAIK